MTTNNPSLWWTASKADYIRHTQYMPPGWRVRQGKDRFEFHWQWHGRWFMIRWRDTKPKGWVCFELVATEVRLSGKLRDMPQAKKLLAISFPTPEVAAVAVHLKSETVM